MATHALASPFKACVSYFHQIFIFSLNDSPSKTMKNACYFIKKALFVLEIFNFTFLAFPLFLPVSHCFNEWSTRNLKLVAAIFCQIFICHHMIVLQKLWKILSISSKKPFSLLRYSNFCISIFPSCSPCQPLL